jgi:glycosyltransferase involved in cell wall biosynthesis
LRVCHIIGSYRPVIGGAERATETLTSALLKEGVDVIVLTRRLAITDTPFELIKGVPVYRLGLPGRSKLHVVTFGLHALALLATRLRRYRVLHVQDVDTSALVGMAARWLPDRKLVTTIHGEWPIIARSRTWSGRQRLRWLVRRSDMFTSINPENTRHLVNAGAKPEMIREIPNGIDESVYQPASQSERRAARAALGLSEQEFVALYMGRLEPYKRVDLLIEAWSGLPHADRGHLLIVGTGSQSDYLRSEVASVESVRLEGPTDDPVTYLRAADVFVNPSGDLKIKWSEGLSVALLEAAFAGVMPIVTIGAGNNVIVQHLVTGLNFPVGDRDALQARLNLAMDDPPLRAKLAQQARDSVIEEYSASAVARRVADVYRELVA